MEQTQNRISDERLAKLAKLDCPAAHWGDFQCHLCERRKMARELTALRASHKRLVEATERLHDSYKLLLSGKPARDVEETLGEARSALAEARKLEGK